MVRSICFLTDPPYTEVGLYEQLVELAAAKLKPGRLCLAYSGQLHLPAVLEGMGSTFTYWWTFAIEFSGSPRAIHSRHVQNEWKPILAFAKPPVKPAPRNGCPIIWRVAVETRTSMIGDRTNQRCST